MPWRKVNRGFREWALASGPLPVVAVFAIACQCGTRIVLGPSHEASIDAAWVGLVALVAGGLVGLLSYFFVSGSETIRREEQGDGGHKDGG
jgi:hypothetical protein